jgi:hypothetical protein
VINQRESEQWKKTTAKVEILHIVFMTIVWKEREDGYLPDETIITSRDLRKYAPDFLVDFYESKMKFVEKVNFFYLIACENELTKLTKR